MDPFGQQKENPDEKKFDPEWLDKSCCFEYCIAAGHSEKRCNDYCNNHSSPKEWKSKMNHPYWPIAWGVELPYEEDKYPKESEPEDKEGCKCTFDRGSAPLYMGYNLERPLGRMKDDKSKIEWPTPGLSDVPCIPGTKRVMRYLGTCMKNGKVCDKSCYVYLVWECRGLDVKKENEKRARRGKKLLPNSMWTFNRKLMRYTTCK